MLENPEAFDYWDTETGDGIYEHEMTERFDDMLDECNDAIVIYGVSFDVSNVLKSTDPIMYRQGFLEYVDGELQEGTITDSNEFLPMECECGEFIEFDSLWCECGLRRPGH